MDAFQAAMFRARANDFVSDEKSVDEKRVAKTELNIKEIYKRVNALELRIDALIHSLSTEKPHPEQQLPQTPETPPVRWPSIGEIITVVCRYYKCTKADILSSRRTHPIVYYRQIAFFLCRIYSKKSLPEIGRRMGGKDHTTVLHAHRKIDEMRQEDGLLQMQLDQMGTIIGRLVTMPPAFGTVPIVASSTAGPAESLSSPLPLDAGPKGTDNG